MNSHGSNGRVRAVAPRRAGQWARQIGALTVCIAVAFVGCGDEHAKPIPSNDRRAVVTQYLAAITDGDVTAAKELCTAQFAERMEGQTHGWLHQSVAVSVVSFGREEIIRPQLVGAADNVQVVNLPVVLTLQQEYSDTLENGPAVHWGFQLRKNPTDNRWLIGDEGLG